MVAPILGIGTTPTGDLDAPQAPQVVGWFVGGPKPGDVGNALLTGHLDWRTGETGVFWDLKKLVPGDDVRVKTERELLRFAVDWTAAVAGQSRVRGNS